MTVGAPRLLHVFPAFGTGGPEVRTALLMNAMPEFRHVVLSLNGEYGGRARLTAPESVETFGPPDGDSGVRLRSLARRLRTCRPDGIVTYGWGGTDAILAARLAGLARPLHIEDGFLPDEAHRQKFARLQVRRIAFRLAAGLMVPSRTLERVATREWWLAPQRVRFVPNGVDTTRFAPPSTDETSRARQEVGAQAGEVVVGTVAALRPDKNHARLLRAFAELATRHPARLLIVGDGPCREALEAQAAALGLAGRVVLPGAALDPSGYYHAMDVFALSSDTEQMPLSVLEAMASGLPVASTDVGDVAGMIAPGSGGAVVARTDEGGLSAALYSFATDEAMRREAGAANRARAVAVYSLTEMIERYRSAFRSLVNTNASSVS
jgi:glycosyltransferase involved in cell wall biosynthesis